MIEDTLRIRHAREFIAPLAEYYRRVARPSDLKNLVRGVSVIATHVKDSENLICSIRECCTDTDD